MTARTLHWNELRKPNADMQMTYRLVTVKRHVISGLERAFHDRELLTANPSQPAKNGAARVDHLP